jgi:hypothetical protein
MGQVVSIQTSAGRRYVGRVSRVTSEHVYLHQTGSGIKADGKVKAITADGKGNGQAGEEIFFAPFIVPLAAIVGLTIVGTAPFWRRPYYRRPYYRRFW